jgi:hypothetical protein
MKGKEKSPHAIISIVPILLVEDLAVKRYVYIFIDVLKKRFDKNLLLKM